MAGAIATNGREQLPDMLKGLAAALVVLGHCV